MKKRFSVIILLVLALQFTYAQKKEEEKKEKTTIKEKIEQLPDMLIAQPDQVDTNADKIVSDNLYMKVHPLWREKGNMTLSDFKLTKTDKDPLVETFPMADKGIAQGLNVGINTLKKSPEEKKQMVLTQVKAHLQQYYKESGTAPGGSIDEKVKEMIISTETFTTDQGMQGQLYLINDIQTQQSNFIVLFIAPGKVAGTTTFAQFTYYRYIYETNFPEDIMEWKFFVYEDDQDAYVKFTKNILKTFTVKDK